MKMLLLRYSTAFICAVFIITGAVSGEDKAVGQTVSFRPDKIDPSVSSIIWKNRISTGSVLKVIEWDVDDGFSIPNPRFKGITTLDQKTGEITITKLTVEHSGVYTIDINSKEHEQRFTLNVMGEDKAVGQTVSFRPARIVPPVTSIIWKHRISTGSVLKVIEWDADDGDNIPNPRFKGITTLDQKTGEITITKLTVEHSGVYTIDINGKEHEQRFTLNVMERVPKPEITIEESSNPDVVYLRCAYSEKIIWKKSSGETLNGMKNQDPGEFITVKNTRNPENFYTCTLKNAVSEEISDPVTERELFGTDAGLIAEIVISVILILLLSVISLICIYLLKESIYNRVNERCPCIESVLSCMDCYKKKKKQYNPASTGDKMKEDAVSPDQKHVYKNGISDATQSQNQ